MISTTAYIKNNYSLQGVELNTSMPSVILKKKKQIKIYTPKNENFPDMSRKNEI